MEISNEETLHITQVFYLTYFSRSQRSNFDNFYDVLQLLNYWADIHQIFILHASNKDTSRIYPGFSFDVLFKVTEVKYWNFYDLLQHLNYQVDLHKIFIMYTSNLIRIHHILITWVFDLTYFSRSQRANFEMFIIFSNTLTIGWFFTKYLSWGLHLIRIHHILPGFLIWPTSQCHRGQTLTFLRCMNVFPHYRVLWFDWLLKVTDGMSSSFACNELLKPVT
jgi:hypothetical protein